MIPIYTKNLKLKIETRVIHALLFDLINNLCINKQYYNPSIQFMSHTK